MYVIIETPCAHAHTPHNFGLQVYYKTMFIYFDFFSGNTLGSRRANLELWNVCGRQSLPTAEAVLVGGQGFTQNYFEEIYDVIVGVLRLDGMGGFNLNSPSGICW